MDNFDLRKYLAEGRLLKEDVSKDPSFVRTKEGLKQIFQQMLSGELSGKEANDQISDFTFGQGSMGIYPDTNSLFLRQFGMGGGDFNDYIIGKFENGGFTPATQPKSKTALKIWNYLSNLKLAEGRLLKEDMASKAVSVLKSYKGEVKGLEDYIKYLMNTSDDISSSIQAVADDMDRDNDAEDSLRRDLEKLSLSEGKLLKEMTIEDVYNDAKRQVKDIYNIDVPMDVVKQWADNYQFPYSREEDPEDEDNYILVYDFGTEERGDFMYWLHDEWDEMPLSKTKRMGPPEGQWDFSK